MLLDKLLNSGNIPLLEQNLRFTGERAKLIMQNGINFSTPGYKQQDLSPEDFFAELQGRLEARREHGSTDFDIDLDAQVVNRGILSHDGNNRTAEQLMSDNAKNAMMHNLAIELLRRQFSQLQTALKERVS